MAKNKMKEKVIDTEPIKDDREEVAEAAQEMVEEQTGDKVTDQAAEEDDKSARMAAAESEWQDKYLRLVAEFDNYRKRTLREKMDLIASGGEDVIKSLLTVMDDIDRALDAMSKSSDIDSIRQGIVLIHQKLLRNLAREGCRRRSRRSAKELGYRPARSGRQVPGFRREEGKDHRRSPKRLQTER